MNEFTWVVVEVLASLVGVEADEGQMVEFVMAIWLKDKGCILRFKFGEGRVKKILDCSENSIG